MYPPAATREPIDLVDLLITGPAAPALDFDQARLHVAALTANDDLLLEGWVQAATSYIEEQTGRQLITATREVQLDRFPGSTPGFLTDTVNPWSNRMYRLELPRPPLQSVVSVSYLDGDGVLQSLVTGSPATPAYTVQNAIQTTPTDPYQGRGWIEPLAGSAWPATQAVGGAVRVRYVAGYGDSDADVPDLLKATLQYLVGNFEQHRSVDLARTGFTEMPMNVASVLLAFERTARSRWKIR